MLERENIKKIGGRESGLSVSTIVDVEEEVLIRRAGEETGVAVKVLSREGEPYILKTGVRGIVPAGDVYLSLQGPMNDLSPFWRRVDELKEQSQKAAPPEGKTSNPGIK